MKKYKLGEKENGLYRIIALIDIPMYGVKAGERGGLIEAECCLSHDGNAWVSGDARVSGDAWTDSPLFIIGTRHSLTACKSGWIKIGCIEKPIQWWLENNVRCGEEHGYTPDQIKEYKLYIDLFAERYLKGSQ